MHAGCERYRPHDRGDLVLSRAFYLFNDPAPPELYTLSLHDALPILAIVVVGAAVLINVPQHVREIHWMRRDRRAYTEWVRSDRKSTRLNSSHQIISYAVFCLKKKKNTTFRARPSPHASSTTTSTTTF